MGSCRGFGFYSLQDNQPTALALPADSQTHGMNMHVWSLRWGFWGLWSVEKEDPKHVPQSVFKGKEQVICGAGI